jgi:hypothetical protein
MMMYPSTAMPQDRTVRPPGGGLPPRPMPDRPADPAPQVKGAMAAFITHVKALDGLDRTSSEYTLHRDRIRELKPALRAVGLFDVMEVRDPEIAAILGMSPA